VSTKDRFSPKVGVLCMAPETGLGVIDHELRERHLDGITRFQL